MSPLERLQLDIAARLAAAPEMVGVFVSAVRPRDEGEATFIQSSLDKALGYVEGRDGKKGAALMVNMPTVIVDEPNSPGPQLLVVMTIRVIESPLFNMGTEGTGVSAEEFGLAVLALLHHWDPGTNNVLYGSKSGAMEPVEGSPGEVIYDVHLRCRIPQMPEDRCDAPAIAQGSTTVSLEVVRSGASIRYTLDGGYPGPDALLYDDPIPTPGPGVRLRAVAYAAGVQASSVSEALFS